MVLPLLLNLGTFMFSIFLYYVIFLNFVHFIKMKTNLIPMGIKESEKLIPCKNT